MIAWTSAMSAGSRTNDSAIMSTRNDRAKRRSSRSLSLMLGALTRTPGRLMPLWFEIRPPSSTVSVTRTPSLASTRSFTRPSSMSTFEPGVTSVASAS